MSNKNTAGSAGSQHGHMAGIRTARNNVFVAWVVENNWDPKKANKKKELILGKIQTLQ